MHIALGATALLAVFYANIRRGPTNVGNQAGQSAEARDGCPYTKEQVDFLPADKRLVRVTGVTLHDLQQAALVDSHQGCGRRAVKAGATAFAYDGDICIPALTYEASNPIMVSGEQKEMAQVGTTQLWVLRSVTDDDALPVCIARDAANFKAYITKNLPWTQREHMLTSPAANTGSTSGHVLTTHSSLLNLLMDLAPSETTIGEDGGEFKTITVTIDPDNWSGFLDVAGKQYKIPVPPGSFKILHADEMGDLSESAKANVTLTLNGGCGAMIYWTGPGVPVGGHTAYGSNKATPVKIPVDMGSASGISDVTGYCKTGFVYEN